jgi:hypothetical protein
MRIYNNIVLDAQDKAVKKVVILISLMPRKTRKTSYFEGFWQMPKIVRGFMVI